MIDEGVSDFLLQLCNKIIYIQRTQVFCFAAYRNFVFLFLFITDNDLIRETVLAVVADFVTDFFVTQIQFNTEACCLQFGGHFATIICLVLGDIHNHHLNRRKPQWE